MVAFKALIVETDREQRSPADYAAHREFSAKGELKYGNEAHCAAKSANRTLQHRSMHHQDGKIGVHENMAGDAAQHSFGDWAVAISAHHEQVRVLVTGEL
jgi:hypothetical protein